MNVLLIGSKGKMGQMMANLLTKKNINFLGIDIDNRSEADNFPADVIIDFSSSNCLKDNLEIAVKKNIPIVIATTNHTEQNFKLINHFKDIIPIFMSSNFSLMFNVLLNIIDRLKLLNNCDFIVSDTHHKHKKDSPSGSCKDIIGKLEQIGVSPTVNSYRVGEIVGIHEIKIFSDYENLEIKHSVSNREVFCEGAFNACQFILTKKNGLFSMQDLIKNKNTLN